MPDAGRRTPDAGRRTPDAGRRTPDATCCPQLTGPSKLPPLIRGGSPSDTIRARAGRLDTAPRARRRLGRAFGLLALAACCALLTPAAALAQAVHVTNLGQTLASASAQGDYLANSFATGGNGTNRFSLTSVVVKFDIGGTNATARIYSVSTSNPGTQVGGDLVRQGSGGSGDVTFNAPSSGITLKGNTTYFLVLYRSGVSAQDPRRTTTDNEDTSSSTGWSIGNVYKTSSNGTSWSDHATGFSLALRVNASVMPTVSTYDPADDATGVAVGKDLVLTFNENVSKVTGTVGNIFIRSSTVPNIAIPVTNSNVSVSGKKVTIDPASDLTPNTSYSVRIDTASFQDSDGNQWGGIVDDTTWNFTTGAPPDATPPSVITGGYSPADDATNVGTNTNLTLTFNETVQKGTGNIVIRTGSNTDITINVTTSQVSIGGTENKVVTINPTNDLSASTAYRVRMAAGVIKDLANNNYAGINDDTTWNFTTAAAPDTTPPTVTNFNPPDDATGVARNANLVLTFNENVQRDASKFIRLWTGSTMLPITASVSGNRLTIDPDSDLAANTEHAVEIQSGAIEDLAGNDYAGFGGVTWSFTTGATTVTPVTPVTPGGGGGSVPPPRPNLVPAFGEMTPISLTLIQHETPAPLILPAATGGDGTLAYTLTPALPQGMTFDAATRTISGTPTAAQAETRYTYTARDEDWDSAELALILTVEADRKPGFGDMTVADRTFQLQARRQGQPPGQPGQRRARVRPQPITPLVLPEAIGGNPPLTYALTPAPPPGLTFDAATRTIRGTPTTVQPASPYRYTVTDRDGDDAALTFTLAVTAPGPSKTEQQVVGDAMAELGRATLAGAADVISARVKASGDTGLTLAGRRLPLSFSALAAPGDADTVRLAGATDPWAPAHAGTAADGADALLRALTDGAPGAGPVYAGTSPDLDTLLRDTLLRDSAISVSLNRDGESYDAPALTLWGRSYARRQFAGQAGSGGWAGATRDAWLGLDARLPGSGLLAGLAVSRNDGEADYRLAGGKGHSGSERWNENEGTLDTTMTTLWPYLSKSLEGGGNVQLMLGAGWGELTRRVGEAAIDDGDEDGDEDRLKTKADLGLLAGVLGGQRPFAWTGGLTFSALGEASALRLATGESPDIALAEQAIWAWRVRGGIEARHAGIVLPVRDWLLSPHGTVAVRHDGGDGVTGAGLELAGGMSLAGPGSRWTMTLAGHWLALHAAEGRREWGVSMDMQLNPLPSGRGWLFSLSPRWGSERDTGALAGDNVFAHGQPGGNSTHIAPSLAAQLGYGLHAFGGRFTLTPALDVDISGTGREVGVGWQLAPRTGTDGHARPLTLSFEAVRREHRNTRVTHLSGPSHPSAPTDHEVWLRLEAGY